jgi:hypothetical protein
MSRLDAQVLSSNSFIIGIADLRGDGRPDYHYHAHVLYGDSLSPPRVPVNGGAISLLGPGFEPGLAVTVGSGGVPVLATNASQMLVAVPAQKRWSTNHHHHRPSERCILHHDQCAHLRSCFHRPDRPVAGRESPNTRQQATNPVRVRVVASDGVTPVNGATVEWTTTNGVALSTCGDISSCSVLTDESGIASTSVTPEAAGVGSITATLAPGAYTSAPSVVATLLAIAPSLSIGVTIPFSLGRSRGNGQRPAYSACINQRRTTERSNRRLCGEARRRIA